MARAKVGCLLAMSTREGGEWVALSAGSPIKFSEQPLGRHRVVAQRIVETAAIDGMARPARFELAALHFDGKSLSLGPPSPYQRGARPIADLRPSDGTSQIIVLRHGLKR